jgi:lipopolysaccharide export system protein LptA
MVRLSALLAAILLHASVQAAEKPSPSLILQSANSNENTFSNGEFISVLRGNVAFDYDDIRIRSDEATWWRTKGTVLFKNKVRVVRGRQLLTCNRMEFAKSNNTLTANGKFDFFDSTELSRLRGNDAEYQIAKKIFFLKGNPSLVRYDTASAETLTITSLTMSYVDSLKRATGVDSVTIRKGLLHSKCGLARYFTESNTAHLRGSPRVWYDLHFLSGDSIDLTFSKEALRDASIMGAGHGIYADTAARTKDTSFTHIWGDSLYMAVSTRGKLEVLWSIGKALSKSFESAAPDQANTASGRTMMLGFTSEGEVNMLKIWGNASSTYFSEDDGGTGCNEVSGDSVAVSFAEGKARFVTLAGSTRGKYFPLR